MSLLWCSTTSFNANVILILTALVFASGCNKPVTNISDSASQEKSACAGDGGLFPTPIGPQAQKKLEKFAISQHLFDGVRNSKQAKSFGVLPAQTPLVALVDESCVLSGKANSNTITGSMLERVSARHGTPTERAYSYKTNKSFTENEIRTLSLGDPCLLHISEDSMIRPFLEPNDPFLNLQTHLTAIEAPSAWDTFYTNLTGETVIAIIDDGMDMTHADLSGILWTNTAEIAANGIDDDNNGYVDDVNGYNFASDLGSPAHENGSTHGTHVAGLAAAQEGNGLGISGVMGRNVRIMVLNVFGPNAGASSANIVNAINYAAEMGAHVINMSLGGQGTAPLVNTAMINAVAAGSFIAIAAGNSNELVTASNFYQPMGYAKDIEGAMAVGSIDATSLQRSSFSNYSTTYVEIGAPGSNSATGGVYSTYPPNTYQYQQGTSMASPVLAGGAALLSGWVRARGQSVTPAQIESMLKTSADVHPALSSFFMGGGSLNMQNLVETALCNY